MGVNMDNIQALLRGGSSSRPTDQNGAAENGQEDRADIQLPGMMSNHDREKIHALFKLQSEYLDRMDSLFSDENETLAELDNRLLAAQQHRDQLRIITALNEHSTDLDGKPRSAWRGGRFDREHIAHNNPLGLTRDHHWQDYKTPLHGLVYGGAELLSLTSPPYRMAILDLLVRFYRANPGPEQPGDGNNDNTDQSVALQRARNACRYLGNIAGIVEWQQLFKMSLQELDASDRGHQLAWLIQAVSIERNGGIDPFETHTSFYRVAGETVSSGVNMSYLDLHFRALAEVRLPEIAMLYDDL